MGEDAEKVPLRQCSQPDLAKILNASELQIDAVQRPKQWAVYISTVYLLLISPKT